MMRCFWTFTEHLGEHRGIQQVGAGALGCARVPSDSDGSDQGLPRPKRVDVSVRVPLVGLVWASKKEPHHFGGPIHILGGEPMFVETS